MFVLNKLGGSQKGITPSYGVAFTNPVGTRPWQVPRKWGLRKVTFGLPRPESTSPITPCNVHERQFVRAPSCYAP